MTRQRRLHYEEWTMRFLGTSAAILVLTAFASSRSLAQTTAADDQVRKDIEALKEGQKALQKEPISIADEPFKGDPNARVALIEFSDYQCPFCGRYNKDVLPQLEDDYVKTGKVKYVFEDFPLDFHKNAFKAAEAAHCAGE